MGGALPADWAHDQGRSLPGTATVRAVEPTRGAEYVVVDVRSATGRRRRRAMRLTAMRPRSSV